MRFVGLFGRAMRQALEDIRLPATNDRGPYHNPKAHWQTPFLSPEQRAEACVTGLALTPAIQTMLRQRIADAVRAGVEDTTR